MLSNPWRESVSRLLVVSLFGMLAPALMAQTAAKSALTGRVTDASGSAVANATVTATSIEIGQTQSATTGPDGTYKLDLAPGNYRVKLEAAGFKTVEIPSVTVSGAETAVLDEKLELEEQSDWQTHAGPTGQFAKRTVQQYDRAFTFGSRSFSRADSGKPTGAGAAG